MTEGRFRVLANGVVRWYPPSWRAVGPQAPAPPLKAPGYMIGVRRG